MLEPLGVAQVRAGVAAYLPGLHRHPVRRGRGTGLHGGLGLLGVGQQPQPQRRELGLTTSQVHQHLPCLIGAHRQQRHLCETVEVLADPAGAVGHRVLLATLVPTAAHE